MRIPKVGEYWYALDGKLLKILNVTHGSIPGKWLALAQIIPGNKKRLIRSQDGISIEKNTVNKQEMDNRKILRAYLRENNGNYH